MSQSESLIPPPIGGLHGQNGLSGMEGQTLVGQHASAPRPVTPLSSYLRMIWRRKFMVIAVAVAMAVPAFVTSHLQTPQYRSSAQLLINETALDANFNAVANDLSDSAMADEAALITSPPVTKRAIQLGASSEVTASRNSSSHVITLQATDSVPAAAAATVRAYIQAYSEYSQDRAQANLTSAIAKLRARIDEFQNSINNALPQDRLILQQQQLRFSEQVTRLDIQRGVTSSSGTVVKDASLPDAPISPTPGRDTGLALIIGLVLGLSLAVLIGTLRARSPSGEAAPVGV